MRGRVITAHVCHMLCLRTSVSLHMHHHQLLLLLLPMLPLVHLFNLAWYVPVLPSVERIDYHVQQAALQQM